MRESAAHKIELYNYFNTFYSSLVSSWFLKLAMTALELKKVKRKELLLLGLPCL